MSRLNLNNLLMLNNLRHMTMTGVKAIILNNETMAVVSGNSIVPMISRDTYEMLAKILLVGQDISIVTHMQYTDSLFGSADMNCVIPAYLTSLPIQSLSGLGLDNIQLTYKKALDYQECRLYLAHTDAYLGPFTYQWLDEHFAKNGLSLSFPVFYSQLKEHIKGEYSEERLFLILLILASLGFLEITHKLSAEKQRTSGSSHMIAIPDKVSLAVFIADNFKRNNHLISVRSRYVVFSYDFAMMDELDVKKETTDEFLFNILTNQVSGGMMYHDRTESSTTNFNSLQLFAQTKLLPTDIFEHEFEEESLQYRYSLIDNNYVNNLQGLIASGVEIVDMSILSLLQTKKMSASEIASRTNFPHADINRALFGLILLGVIGASHEIDLPVKRNTDMDSNRDALRKVVEKVRNI